MSFFLLLLLACGSDVSDCVDGFAVGWKVAGCDPTDPVMDNSAQAVCELVDPTKPPILEGGDLGAQACESYPVQDTGFGC